MTVGFALIRHGQYAQPPGVPSAHLPHPLIAEGREQAIAGCQMLARVAAERDWEIDPVIDASPLLRAWQTAELFADRLGPEFRVDCFDALTERSLGSAANLTMDEIAAVIERDPRFHPLPDGWKRRSEFRLPLPGAESLVDAGRRVARHLERRRAELEGHAGVAIKVIVGHGGSLRHGAAALGMLDIDDLSTLSMYHCRPVVYVRDGGGWRRSFGEWKPRGANTDND